MNLAALRFHDFRIYLAGNIFALNGLWMQRLTMGWIAWELTGSASFVGFVAFMNFAPTVVTGPFFGVMVDRIRLRRAAMINQGILCALTLLLFLSFEAGILGPTLLAVVSGVLGLSVAAHHPIRMSLAPRLVDQSAVASVISMTAINFNLARLTGPALGGWVIAVWGVGAALFLQALLFLPLILAVSFINPRESQKNRAEPTAFFQDLGFGIRYVSHSPLIRRAILIAGVGAFLSRGVLEILPVVADGTFSKGAGGVGVMTAIAGCGALVAGIAKAVMPGQAPGRLPRLALGSALFGVSLVPIVGISTSWALTLALVAGLGFATTMAGVSMQTAIQMEIEDDFRGRVMSLWVVVVVGAAAGGAMILGGLADLFGLALALGSVGGVGAVFLAFYLRRIW